MSRAASGQIRHRSSERQVQTLDIRGVEPGGILRAFERFLKSPRCSDHGSPLDFDHPILPPGFDHLSIDADRAKQPTNNMRIEFEAIRCYQRNHAGWVLDAVAAG